MPEWALGLALLWGGCVAVVTLGRLAARDRDTAFDGRGFAAFVALTVVMSFVLMLAVSAVILVLVEGRPA